MLIWQVKSCRGKIMWVGGVHVCTAGYVLQLLLGLLCSAASKSSGTYILRPELKLLT